MKMPPIDYKGKLPITEYVNVFKDEEGGRGVVKPDLVVNGNPSAFVSRRREEAGGVGSSRNVGTRHRYTFELDRFYKNAMVVLEYDSYAGSEVVVDKVKSTFEKFRFDVEIHRNATRDEVKAICDTFFQQNLNEFGALGVVIVGHRGPRGEFVTPGAGFTKRDIWDYFFDENNDNIRSERPMIFLTQADNSEYTLDEDNRCPRNFFEMHLPPATPSRDLHDTRHCPLSLLCDKVDELADEESFPKIALATLSAIEGHEGDQHRRDHEFFLSYIGRNIGYSSVFKLPSSRGPHSVFFKMDKHLYFWRT